MYKCEKDGDSLSKRIAENDDDIDNEAGWLTKRLFMFPTATIVKVQASYITMFCLIWGMT